MSGFSPSWLALREPHDDAARSTRLAARLADHLAAGRRGDRPVAVLDLGSGTGANLRWLAPALAQAQPQRLALGQQHWRLVDHDPALLALAAADPIAVTRTTVARDLAAGLTAGDPGIEPGADLLDGVDVVTASALLDLVSNDWIDGLADRLAERGIAALFALNYDGSTTWSPVDARDGAVLERFNDHQRGDKGFGPAAGPAAGERMAAALRARGFEVLLAPTPWQLSPAAADIQTALAGGIAEALSAADPAARDWLEDWCDRRLGHVRQRQSSMHVGHLDLLALPPGAI